jgi:hypothetical protein
MVLAESKTISFDDFIAWLPERSAFRSFPDLELSIDRLYQRNRSMIEI